MQITAPPCHRSTYLHICSKLFPTQKGQNLAACPCAISLIFIDQADRSYLLISPGSLQTMLRLLSQSQVSATSL